MMTITLLATTCTLVVERPASRPKIALAAWLESLTEDMLGEIVSFPPPIDPPTKSRFELLLGIKEHEMHHRAQLMPVERLLGIVPHLTRARQARS